VTSSGLLPKYLLITELRFEAMLYSSLGNENSDAGHIKFSRGPQAPHPMVYIVTLPRFFVVGLMGCPGGYAPNRPVAWF